MKKTISLLSVLLISSILFGQIEIQDDYQPGVILNGTTLYTGVPSAHLQIINKSGVTSAYNWKRTVLNTSINQALFSDQICDNNGCFNCTYFGTPPPPSFPTWASGGSDMITVLNNDSTKFQPKLSVPNGGTGDALIRYYVLDALNGDYPIDSIDIQYNTYLNIENTTNNYSVYPNPANSVLNISISENNTSITIFDIVGKNVAEMELVNGNNTLNIENLKPGVYFYSIKRNGEIMETEKLIVR